MGLSLFAVLLLAPQPLVEVQDTANDNEIVVIAEKFKKWTGKYKIRGNAMRCKTRQSSGDREIDAIGCQAFESCAFQLKTRIAASDEKNLEKSTRVKMKDAIKRDLSSCVIDKRKTLIADLANKRARVN